MVMELLGCQRAWVPILNILTLFLSKISSKLIDRLFFNFFRFLRKLLNLNSFDEMQGIGKLFCIRQCFFKNFGHFGLLQQIRGST